MNRRELEETVRRLRQERTETLQTLANRQERLGELLACKPAYGAVTGWEEASSLCRELDALQDRIAQVEKNQERWRQIQDQIKAREKQLQALEQRHRIGLQELGRVALKLFRTGSPTLAKYGILFENLVQLEERLERQRSQQAQSQDREEGMLGRIKRGAENLAFKFQEMLLEARKKALCQELGVELIRLRLADTVLAKEDPAVFLPLLEDAAEWALLFEEKEALEEERRRLQEEPHHSGWPFEGTLRELKATSSALEAKKGHALRDLAQAWEHAGYAPPPDEEGLLQALEETRSTRQRLASVEADLERHEHLLKALDLEEQACEAERRAEALEEEARALRSRAAQLREEAQRQRQYAGL